MFGKGDQMMKRAVWKSPYRRTFSNLPPRCIGLSGDCLSHFLSVELRDGARWVLTGAKAENDEDSITER
ncbi:hypothetical protein [Paraburkholderia mimosarum]|uniref:hypothetical protein n=1 Tax=Paraburkholderia mimosarum TaxID=312026 RepID=UPI001470695D|nr:hypothetical protein [Paraburkholderia mimosarum]